jgi:hypothetical protein
MNHAIVDAHAREKRNAVQSLDIMASPYPDVEEIVTAIDSDRLFCGIYAAPRHLQEVPVRIVQPTRSGIGEREKTSATLIRRRNRSGA